MEHLTDKDKEKTRKNSKTPFESFLGIAEQQEKAQGEGASNGVSVTHISINNRLDHIFHVFIYLSIHSFAPGMGGGYYPLDWLGV